ncbi:MAG: hypothetical protein AAF442_05450 [Pseudomonadota bacterium]
MIRWPESLPLPLRASYGVATASDVIRTAMETGPDRVRPRSFAQQAVIPVAWDFDDPEYRTFADWHRSSLANGTAWFTMNLLMDDGMKLRKVRFVEDFDAKKNKGIGWRITARLEVQTASHEESAAAQLQKVIEQVRGGTELEPGSIDTDLLADRAVTSDTLADGAVINRVIEDRAVTEDKIADGGITTDKLMDGAVTREKLAPFLFRSKIVTVGEFTASGTINLRAGLLYFFLMIGGGGGGSFPVGSPGKGRDGANGHPVVGIGGVPQNTRARIIVGAGGRQALNVLRPRAGSGGITIFDVMGIQMRSSAPYAKNDFFITGGGEWFAVGYPKYGKGGAGSWSYRHVKPGVGGFFKIWVISHD